MCGGTSVCVDSRLALKGLSPRVRGNRQVLGHDIGIPRSIPACAGEPGVVGQSH